MANWRVLIFNCSTDHFISYWELLIPLLRSDWVKGKATKVYDCRWDLWTSSIVITWDLVRYAESGLTHIYRTRVCKGFTVVQAVPISKMTPAGDLRAALDCMVCWPVYFRMLKNTSVYDGDENSVWRYLSPYLLNPAFLLKFHFDEDTARSRLPYLSRQPYCPSSVNLPRSHWASRL